MIGAFVISFYFSANTIIYYLLRREVDATEMDDVYLEQSDEDFGESMPPSATPDATPAGASTGASATTMDAGSPMESPGNVAPTTLDSPPVTDSNLDAPPPLSDDAPDSGNMRP